METANVRVEVNIESIEISEVKSDKVSLKENHEKEQSWRNYQKAHSWVINDDEFLEPLSDVVDDDDISDLVLFKPKTPHIYRPRWGKKRFRTLL